MSVKWHVLNVSCLLGNIAEIICYAFMLLTISSSPVLCDTLLGIDYNSATGKNELRVIDSVSGSVNLISSFTFDSGYWGPGSFGINPILNSVYVQSTAGTLYKFENILGNTSSPVTLPLMIKFSVLKPRKDGMLIGIVFNAQSIDFYEVDPNTGTTTLKNSVVANKSGISVFTPTVDFENGVIYFETADNTLYKFDSISNSVTTVPMDKGMQVLGVRKDGYIVGIASDGVRLINPLTGISSLISSLTSFTYSASDFTTDSYADLIFVQGLNGVLYTRSAQTGSVINSVVLGITFQAIGALPQISKISEKNLGPSCPCEGNPINPATGNKFQLETDFNGSEQTGLELKRFYNSQDTKLSAFGANCRGTWQRVISLTNSTTASVISANGRVDTFTKNVSGVWASDPDVTSTLTAIMSGSTQTGWKLVTADDSIEIYTLSGQLYSVTDRAGNVTTLTYNSNNQLTTVTGPFGHKLTFTYNSSNLVTSITLPDGGVLTYGYDASKNLTSVRYPDNTVRQYVYNEQANTANTSLPNALTGIIDESGNRYATYQYDAQGRAISSTHASGEEQVNLAYNADGSTSVIDALGNVHSYSLTTQFGLLKPIAVTGIPVTNTGGKAFTYDSNGFVASRTDWNGNVTTYTHDTRGNETSRTEASGTTLARTITTLWHPVFHLPTQITEPSDIAGVNRVTSLSYDSSQGTLLQKTVTAGALTRTWTYTYNLAGQTKTVTDPNGNVTSFSYDASGGLASVTNALGQVTLYSNDADGRPVTLTDPNGLVTTITYTQRGKIASSTIGQELTTFAYNPNNQLQSVTKPDGSLFTYSYNTAHQLTGVTDTFGNHINYALDAMGNRTGTKVTDAANNIVRNSSSVYDAVNRLTQFIGSQGQSTQFQYDANGNLTTITDPLGNAQSKTYDALNRLIQAIDPNGGKTVFSYDASNKLQQVTDPLGLKTQYTRDGLSNLLTVNSPDTHITQKTYDPAGNVLTSTDARGKVTTYTYDALNRLISIHRNDGGVITYSYDTEPNSIGHLVKMIDDTDTTHWSYDSHGRVIAKTQTYAGEQLSSLGYTYDNKTGLLAQMTYPSGFIFNYLYDKGGRLNQINLGSSPVVSNISYTPLGDISSMQYFNGTSYTRHYDTDGRINQYTVFGSRSVALTYDAASRITQFTDSDNVVNQTMGYDTLGRIDSVNGFFGTENYTYDANGNRLSSVINGSINDYTYDAASNRLLSISLGNGGNNTTLQRTYDAMGNTLTTGTQSFTFNDRGQLQTAGGATYIYNGLGQRIYKSNTNTYMTYDDAGHVIGEFTYHGPKINETLYVGDIPVAFATPTAAYVINTDHLNAPRVITDSAGNFVSFWDFVPFGERGLLTASNPETYNARFPGQYYDAESGLNQNGFRDYEPGTGRYIESDPIGLKGGINTYGYVRNNPVLFKDYKGLDAKEIIDFIIEFEEKIIRSNQEKHLREIISSGDNYIVEPGDGVTLDEIAQFYPPSNQQDSVCTKDNPNGYPREEVGPLPKWTIVVNRPPLDLSKENQPFYDIEIKSNYPNNQ